MIIIFMQFAAILLLTLGVTFLLGRVMKSKGFKVNQTANCLINEEMKMSSDVPAGVGGTHRITFAKQKHHCVTA